MREIKFRAWHSKLNKMFSPEEMSQDQMTLLLTGSFINVHGASTRLSQIIPRDIMIPLQYTGLKAINGEIFEGDILKSGIKPWIVKFVAPCFMMTQDDRERLIHERVEIIGNIYANPELLKGVK